MPLLRALRTEPSTKRPLIVISALCCLGIFLGGWEAYECAKINFGYVASYSFVGAVAVLVILIAVGSVLAVYWRTRKIGIGFILAGILSCVTFYGGISVLIKLDRVAWRHEPRIAIGADQMASVVIYFCPKTTSEEIEDFSESVLQQDAKPRHAGRDFPTFVGSYLRLSPDQAHGYNGVALSFRESTTQPTVMEYLTGIESDRRVAKVFTDIVPSAIRVENRSSIEVHCQ